MGPVCVSAQTNLLHRFQGSGGMNIVWGFGGCSYESGERVPTSAAAFAAPHVLQIVPSLRQRQDDSEQAQTARTQTRRRNKLTSFVVCVLWYCVVGLLGDPTFSIYQPVSVLLFRFLNYTVTA